MDASALKNLIKAKEEVPTGIVSLRFEDVNFGYEGAPQIFSGLTVNIPLNGNFLVTGASGSGQSTFLKLLAALVQPTEGRYLVNGENTTEMSFEEFLPYRKRIGYTFDVGGLFANRTLHDNLTLPLVYHKIHSPEEASQMVHELATKFSFEKQLHQRPSLVSGGLRKLVCVLRAFLCKHEMLVMDDPFTGIGRDASRLLVELVHERKSTGELKHVYLTSREDIGPAMLGCDTLVIDNGTVRAST